MPLKIETLNDRLSIDSVEDGAAYRLPLLQLSQTNLYLRVGLAGELYIKRPSEYGWKEYLKFAKMADSSSQDIRSLEEIEKFEQLQSVVPRFSWLKPLAPVNPTAAHYFAIHAMQYGRLRSQSAVGIPRARFGVLVSRRMWLMKRFDPVLFQERVRGTTLWDMFDFAAKQVSPRWRPCLSAISVQLSNLLASDVLNHIDWNIKNFVFDEAKERLFYVDMKPTIFGAKSGNDLNLSGIRDYFVV